MFDYIVGFLLVLWVFLALKVMKKKKSGCTGNCTSCAKTCGSDLKERYEKDKNKM